IYLESGKIKRMFNRTNEIPFFEKGSKRFMEGIYDAVSRGYLKDYKYFTGQVFGELIGMDVSKEGNVYQSSYRWLPFKKIYSKYHYKFWNEDIVKDIVGLEEVMLKEKQLFKAISETFESLWSLFKREVFGRDEIPNITKDVGFDGLAAEGIVFYKKSAFNEKFEVSPYNMCKLRRDMFPWYNKEGKVIRNFELTHNKINELS
ncbi:MAG: hypothetical protein WC942_11165, partial [Clostridia bacterium]